MRILLVQGTVYYPTYGGANKANRLLLEALAVRGHECRVVAPITGTQMKGQEFAGLSTEGGVCRYERAGVKVCAVKAAGRLRENVMREARESEPDLVLVASEDPGQSLLEAALNAQPERVLYLARTTLALPFGPAAAIRSTRSTNLLLRVAGIVTVSDYLRDYIRRWSGIQAESLPLELYGGSTYPDLSRFGSGNVTLVNACAVKGIDIFLDLARTLSHLSFAAVASWGTTESDVARLESLPNVRVLQPVEDITDIFAQTTVLLAPSLWAEARGRVITEAMAHGIPVLASNVGGIDEAKLGVDYMIPVREIQEYESRVDTRMMPLPVIPPQDVRPWIETLDHVTSNRDEYDGVSRESRTVALAHIEAQAVTPFEDYLVRLSAKPPAAGVGYADGTVSMMTASERIT
jgi:glycosyltransferase involved in cell wall biosynthesis